MKNREKSILGLDERIGIFRKFGRNVILLVMAAYIAFAWSVAFAPDYFPRSWPIRVISRMIVDTLAMFVASAFVYTWWKRDRATHGAAPGLSWRAPSGLRLTTGAVQ